MEEPQMTFTSDAFGKNVFSLETMKKKLPKSSFIALSESIEKRSQFSLEQANVIAHVIMDWAISKGATHYTHWFHPMTGLTAQKHDAFFSFDSQCKPIESFSGSQLFQSEPDASSFPSGGMRSTFEARGYTAWDPSSPVFVMTSGKVPVLFIPSVFFSYTGQALDKKTPLLRSTKTLNRAASKAMELLTGNKLRVESTVGVEQEYFLVDRKYYEKRPDLIMAGRTLLGCRPAKGQQMEDHYFGSIKDRVLAFMHDMEAQLYELGVPCKTRHNEVAPHQFEMAPIFESANLAADHNQITMELIRKVAQSHGLAALLHEKPFADVNGSGKHLNWSLQASNQSNLLEPGKQPHCNLEFLYFLVAIINAVHKRGPVLRSTIAGPGNDHRLGANEAPPAIMSVFLGSHVTDILEKIEKAERFSEATLASIDLGLAELPGIQVDNTDRNRTSPFAFTGNKFEFRAVGSSQSISMVTAVLNAAVAESLDEMNGELEKLKVIDEKSVFKMLRPFIKRSKPVRFEGNNYSEEWEKAAAERGLPNCKNTPAAYEVWEDQDVRNFVKQSGILNESEMDAHTMVRLEHYAKTIDIETSLLVRLVDTYVLPAGLRYQGQLAQSLASLQSAASEDGWPFENSIAAQRDYLKNLSSQIEALIRDREQLLKVWQEMPPCHGEREGALAYANQVIPWSEKVRSHCDELESLIDCREWDLPGYHELLFLM